MPYEVVARRWRPLTFDSVVGQHHVTATLANAIERGRVAHAFLFTGIRGVGKTTAARLLARALNCSSRKGAEPCNECDSCRQILAGASVDVLEIDGASNRGIEEVRALIDAASYRPAASPYRIYIIDEVHQLTREAFNALLKILEEPPDHIKFVMATTEAHKVPATVLSRCQRYDFRRLTVDEIAKQLDTIVKHDELDVSADALTLIAREADGSMRDAQSLLEQVASATGGQANLEDTAQVLGIASTDLINGCVQSILEGNSPKIVEIMNELRRTATDLEKFLFEVLELVRHVAVANAAGADALAESIAMSVRDTAAVLAEKRNQLDLQRIFGSLLRTADDLRRGGMPELVLEMGLLKAASLESVMSSAEILARLGGGTGPATAAGSGGRTQAAAARPAPRTASPPTSAAPQRSRDSGTARSTAGPAQAASPAGGSTTASPAPAREPAAPRRTRSTAEPGTVREDGAAVSASGDASRATNTLGTTTGGAEVRASEISESEPQGLPSGQPNQAPPPSDADAPTDTDVPGDDNAPGAGRECALDPNADPAARWAVFLEILRVEGGLSLFLAASNCEMLRMEPDRLDLRPMNKGVRTQLEDAEMIRRLRTLVQTYLGEAMRVQLVDAGGAAASVSGPNAAASGVSAHSIEADRQARMQQRTLADPIVQTVLEVFDGKVEAISQADD